jgi:2-polyprenyl-3-methyl-5-hydroxy-6-metoxy-1,4-benzoquinol methylase
MNDVLRAFYEEKALGYPEHDAPSIVRYEKAVELAKLASGQTILDVACKDAVLLDLLERIGAQVSYTGLDISSRVLEANRNRRPNAAFVLGDIVQGTTFHDKSFDRIFALEILEHVPNPVAMLQEIRRLLKDDGQLLVSVPNPYYYMEFINELRSFPENDGHLFAFRDANVRAVLSLCGFDVDDVVGTYLLIPRRLRGAFRTHDFWIMKRVPKLLACSRIYRCRGH